MTELQGFISQFTDKELFPDSVLIRDSFFSIDADTEKALQMIKDKQAVLQAGFFLGSMKRNTFTPSTILLDEISRHSEKKVALNEKGSWLFLCERDVFNESITKAGTFDGIALIQNKHNENLGYGRFNSKGSVAIKHIFDKGDFLRRER